MATLSSHSIERQCVLFLGSAMSDADRFRQEAESCLSLEAATDNLTDREALLWIAVQWIQLAHAAEYLSRSTRSLQ
jgi:hypothetical protein